MAKFEFTFEYTPDGETVVDTFREVVDIPDEEIDSEYPDGRDYNINSEFLQRWEWKRYRSSYREIKEEKSSE